MWEWWAEGMGREEDDREGVLEVVR